jgi:hypothetical protein
MTTWKDPGLDPGAYILPICDHDPLLYQLYIDSSIIPRHTGIKGKRQLSLESMDVIIYSKGRNRRFKMDGKTTIISHPTIHPDNEIIAILTIVSKLESSPLGKVRTKTKTIAIRGPSGKNADTKKSKAGLSRIRCNRLGIADSGSLVGRSGWFFPSVEDALGGS